METREKLESIIGLLEDQLNKEKPGTDLYIKISETLERFYKLKIEDDQQNNEAWEKQERLSLEKDNLELDRESKKSEKLREWVKICLSAICSGGVGILCLLTLGVEVDGRLNTQTIKNLIMMAIRRK